MMQRKTKAKCLNEIFYDSMSVSVSLPPIYLCIWLLSIPYLRLDYILCVQICNPVTKQMAE